MRKYKQKNPRNTIYKEKWQLEEQLLTAKKGREASESLVWYETVQLSTEQLIFHSFKGATALSEI